MGRIADPLVRRFAARYLPRLRRRYRPELVLVFGSRAGGSEHFRGVSFLERASALMADLDLPFSADVLCYTPEEFARNRGEHGNVRLALEEGLRL